MYKYAELKRFHHDCQLQAYVCVFMYVDSKTVPVEDHFPDTKTFVVNYNKMSTAGPGLEHCLVVS